MKLLKFQARVINSAALKQYSSFN